MHKNRKILKVTLSTYTFLKSALYSASIGISVEVLWQLLKISIFTRSLLQLKKFIEKNWVINLIQCTCLFGSRLSVFHHCLARGFTTSVSWKSHIKGFSVKDWREKTCDDIVDFGNQHADFRSSFPIIFSEDVEWTRIAE